MKQNLVLVILPVFFVFKTYGQARPVELPQAFKPIPGLARLLPVGEVQNLVASYLGWEELETLRKHDNSAIAIPSDNNALMPTSLNNQNILAHNKGQKKVSELSSVSPIIGIQHIVIDFLNGLEQFQNIQMIYNGSVEVSLGNKFLIRGTNNKIEIHKRSAYNAFVLMQELEMFRELSHGKFYEQTPVQSIACSSDDKYLAAWAAGMPIKIWQFNGDKFEKFEELCPSSNGKIAFSQDGKFFASGCIDRKIQIWNLMNNKFTYVQTLENDEPIGSIAFADNDKLMICTHYGNVKLWKNKPERIRSIAFKSIEIIDAYGIQNANNVRSAISHNGKYIICGKHRMEIWQLENDTLKHKQTIEAKDQSVKLVSFSPEGSYLAFTRLGSNLEIWQLMGEQFINTNEMVIQKTTPNSFDTTDSFTILKLSSHAEYLILGKQNNLDIFNNLGQSLLLNQKTEIK
jgi:WD40 repeat protein